MPPVEAVAVSKAGAEPVHTIWVALAKGPVIGASAKTVAVTVLGQPLVAVAVTVKVTRVALRFEFIKLPEIDPLPLLAMVEAIPGGFTFVQLVMLPVGSPEMVIGTMATLSHASCVRGAIEGNGFTVTVTLDVVPGHPFAEGVMV